MRQRFLGFAAVLALAATPAFAAVVTPGTSEGSTTDLFNGATVTLSSPILAGFTASDAFGTVTSNGPYAESLAGGHVIFQQNLNDFLYFQTAAPVTIGGFKIYASSDGVGNPARGFTNVRLSGSSNGVNYTLLDASNNYGAASGPVTITGSFTPGTYQYFIFEGLDLNGGARLLEIDAIGVPEPASLAMLAAGLGIVGAVRRRRPQPA